MPSFSRSLEQSLHARWRRQRAPSRVRDTRHLCSPAPTIRRGAVLRACNVVSKSSAQPRRVYDAVDYGHGGRRGIQTDHGSSADPAAVIQAVLGPREVTARRVGCIFAERESMPVFPAGRMTRYDSVLHRHGIASARMSDRSPRAAGRRDRTKIGAKEMRRPTRSGLLLPSHQEGSDGKIDPLIGARYEISRTIRFYAAPKNNPLSRRAGVVRHDRRCACARSSRRVPEVLDLHRLLARMGSLLAHALRGDFEERP